MTPRKEVIGSGVLQLAPMLSDVSSSRHNDQVGNGVVQRVPVDMVDNTPPWNSAVFGLPNMNSPQFPYVWFCYFHVNAFSSRFVASYSLASYRKPLIRFAPRLKLCAWGKVSAPHSFIPWGVPLRKRVRRPFANSPLVTMLMVIWHFSNRHVPLPATLLATEACCVSAIRFHLKLAAANLASFCNHTLNMWLYGATSIGVAYQQPRLFEEPAPKPKQEALL